MFDMMGFICLSVSQKKNEKATGRKKPARRGLKSGTRLKVWRPETESLFKNYKVII
jgi:hypothetical protein